MAASRLDVHPDFYKWVEFLKQYDHVSLNKAALKASKQFGENSNTWRGRVQRIRAYVAQQKTVDTRRGKRLKEMERQFVEVILGRSFPYLRPPQRLAKRIDSDKTVVVSDPHDPYSAKEVWDAILSSHHDASHIHINGDLADFYSRSHFRKIEGDEWFYNEVRSIFNRMEWLSTHFQKATIIRGNHDNRTQKKLADELQSDMLWMVEDDILLRCAEYFDNVKIVGQRLDAGGESVNVEFLWQYKDVLFTHIERSQEQSSGLAETIAKQMGRWSATFGLSGYKWIVQGHNHRNDCIDVGWGYVFIMPCAARPLSLGMKYGISPSMKGKPPKIGYMVIKFKDGHAQYNDSRVYEVNYQLNARSNES